MPNARGPNTVQFGPDRVRAFCDANGLKLVVIRAHQVRVRVRVRVRIRVS